MAGFRTKVLVAAAWLAGCGGTTATTGTDGGSGSTPIGAMCLPSPETSASFSGFDFHEVTLDLDNAGCSGAPCIVNHFQGRVSCPYGGTACKVPGTGSAVTVSVAPECVDRRPADAVYCSCRCANPQGRTDDGASYCACPAGFTCSQFYASVGPSNASTAGAYCIKNGTTYDPATVCSATCDAQQMNCP